MAVCGGGGSGPVFPFERCEQLRKNIFLQAFLDVFVGEVAKEKQGWSCMFRKSSESEK